MGLNKCLPPLTRIPWNAGWTTNVWVILMDNVTFLLPFRVSKLRTSSQSGYGGCTGLSKSLWKQTSLGDFHTNPKYCSDQRRWEGKPTEGKSPQICNYLFLTMVLLLGSAVVCGATVYFLNISSKPVSATKSRLSFHFPSQLHNYKEVLVCIFVFSKTLQE